MFSSIVSLLLGRFLFYKYSLSYFREKVNPFFHFLLERTRGRGDAGMRGCEDACKKLFEKSFLRSSKTLKLFLSCVLSKIRNNATLLSFGYFSFTKGGGKLHCSINPSVEKIHNLTLLSFGYFSFAKGGDKLHFSINPSVEKIHNLPLLSFGYFSFAKEK